MRSALTALGVIIGVGAVIAMTEIGEGSKTAVQKTIAGMGANNLLVLPGAAMSGGVSYGAGSRPTLTPEDGEQLARQCPAISDFALQVTTRAQLIYGRTNWNTQSVVGTTPNYLNVRDWTEMEEGDVFSDRDVLNANKVCMVGTTIKRELFDNESPVGKELRISNVAFRVIGVLSSKGANMMGRDQDDIVIAPWTTIKFRLNAVSSNAVASANPTESQTPTSTINSLSNTYPNSTALYPSFSDVEQADTPQSGRMVTVDNILVKAASGEQIPEAIREIKSLLRERHHIKTPSEDDDTHDDFNIRDMTEILKTITQNVHLDGHPAADRGRHFADRGRSGHHEHHARLGDGADAGNRPADGRRRPQPPHPPAVPRGSRRALPGGRRRRRSRRTVRFDPGPPLPALADPALAPDHHHLRRRLRGRGHRLRFLSRLEGLAARSHRSLAI